MNLTGIISQAAKLEVSDVHINVGRPQVYRLHGVLYPVNASKIIKRLDIINPEEIEILTPADTDRMAREIMTQGQYDKFKERGELDFPFQFPG